MADNEIDKPYVRPFADFLRETSKGATHEELSDALHDLVARVRDTGKKGSVTLTVTAEPMKGSERALFIKDEIKLRLPEYDRDSTIFYADDHGNLTRRDPDQMEFESLREVPPPNVDLATGEVRETVNKTKGA